MSMMHHFSGLLNTKVNMKLHSQPILFYNVKYFRAKRTSVDCIHWLDNQLDLQKVFQCEWDVWMGKGWKKDRLVMSAKEEK